MLNEKLATFTDRREAVALFEHLRGRDANTPWPLLPILTFVAPGGSGKSTLIEYLIATRCCDPRNGQPAIPYARLDFTQPGVPRDLLSILVNLRDQLQFYADRKSGSNDSQAGQHLPFPRFDLGAAIANAFLVDGNLPTLSSGEVRKRLASAPSQFGPFGDMGNALGNLGSYYALIPPLIVGLRLAGQIAPVQEIMSRLDRGPGWQWYKQQDDIGLRASTGIRDVMLRLYSMSIPGRPERTQLIEQILPAAFVADLYDALVQSNPPKAWSKVANVVLFLDGFESLLDSSETSRTAMRLLESLTLSTHRERGETDPLLVVLGTRQREALELTQERIPTQPLHEQQTELLDNPTVGERIRALHAHWQQRIPRNRRYLTLRNLYLPLWLQDFGLDDTRRYLETLDSEMPPNEQLFREQKLVEAIHEVTHGHPLALALAAAAFQEADARGRSLHIDTFVEEVVSRQVIPGHENESIEHYLLNLFLRQLSEAERDDLIYCAAPRYLDAAIQRAILQLTPGPEARRRWDAYRRLTFVSNIADERIVFHPVVRALLLRQLAPDADPTSSYFLTHTRLQTHFHTRATQGDELARIEEAYHALALDDAERAIQTGIDAQNLYPTLWDPLLEMVEQAPIGLIPPDTEQRAYDALERAERNHGIQDAVSAILLFTWLLNASPTPQDAARLQICLGNAYSDLPTGDRGENLHHAIGCYEQALLVYTREAAPLDWAMTQNNLGIAYLYLPTGDRGENLRHAIAYLSKPCWFALVRPLLSIGRKRKTIWALPTRTCPPETVARTCSTPLSAMSKR